MSRRAIRHRRAHRHHVPGEELALPVAPALTFGQWLRKLLAAVFEERG